MLPNEIWCLKCTKMKSDCSGVESEIFRISLNLYAADMTADIFTERGFEVELGCYTKVEGSARQGEEDKHEVRVMSNEEVLRAKIEVLQEALKNVRENKPITEHQTQTSISLLTTVTEVLRALGERYFLSYCSLLGVKDQLIPIAPPAKVKFKK